MRLNDAIGDTLRSIRLEKNLTLRQVSAKGHVATGHISDIERGKKNASHDMLEAIAVGLDISTVDLIGEVYDYMKIYEYLGSNDQK